MLLVVAGIPSHHFNRFQQLSGRVAGSGHSVIGISSSTQSLNCADGEQVISRVAKFAIREPGKASQGFGVIYLAPQWAQCEEFEAALHPATILLRIDLPIPLETRGRAGEVYINRLVQRVSAEAPKIIRAVGAMRSEVGSRMNRTPLLLPLRNFGSTQLRESVAQLARDLPGTSTPHELIKAACQQIEAQHPYQSKGPNKGFEDDDAIVFKSPGRDLHGSIWEKAGPGHKSSCALNGLFRLGAAVTPGFHFDCVRPPRLIGQFHDCHGDRAHYTGRPHLNIAPNDFVRG